jgi:hypothetical protein
MPWPRAHPHGSGPSAEVGGIERRARVRRETAPGPTERAQPRPAEAANPEGRSHGPGERFGTRQRGVLAPVGHGLWSAILGGVLFSASDHRHFALTLRLLLSYLGVALLHALWDAMHGIALVLTLLLTGTPWQYVQLEQGYQPQPTALQADVFTVLSWGGLALVSVIGIGWLLAVRARARRGERAAAVLWRIPASRPR